MYRTPKIGQKTAKKGKIAVVEIYMIKKMKILSDSYSKSTNVSDLPFCDTKNLRLVD